MGLGLGVFLGAIVLATVVLYLKMRTIWNWRAIWRRLGLAGLGFVVLLVAVIAVVTGHEKWQDRLQVVTALESISLGERMSDVVFRHGQFKQDSSDSETDGSERFVSDEKRMAVYVRAGIVEKVVYICKDEMDYASAGKVFCGKSGETILDRYGSAIRVQCPIKKESDLDHVRRVYDATDFGVRYFLQQNKVIGFAVMDKQRLAEAVGINWIACT